MTSIVPILASIFCAVSEASKVARLTLQRNARRRIAESMHSVDTFHLKHYYTAIKIAWSRIFFRPLASVFCPGEIICSNVQYINHNMRLPYAHRAQYFILRRNCCKNGLVLQRWGAYSVRVIGLSYRIGIHSLFDSTLYFCYWSSFDIFDNKSKSVIALHHDLFIAKVDTASKFRKKLCLLNQCNRRASKLVRTTRGDPSPSVYQIESIVRSFLLYTHRFKDTLGESEGYS